MSNSDVREPFLNPITLEAHCFLQSVRKYGKNYEFLDEELVSELDALVDAINVFYDKALTNLHEKDGYKLVKVKDLGYIHHGYTCLRCQKYLGPSAEKTARHICELHADQTEAGAAVVPKKEKKPKKQKKSKVPNKLPKKARALFELKINKLTKNMCKTAHTLKLQPSYDLIERDLMKNVQHLFPDKKLKVYKFGSRISGIGNENSDLDIFVAIDGSFSDYSYRASAQTKEQMSALANAMKKDKNWSKLLLIISARVPIIRLKHHSTNINCDIGFSNSMGYCNTLLMEHLFELQPIAIHMCVFIKEWLFRINVDNFISTYGFMLMIVFYLQMYYALPSVEDLQEGLENPEFIGPWICNFRRKPLKHYNLELIEVTKANIREQIYNFFIFYGEFDYEKYAICPYIGEVMRRDELTSRLPDRYQNFMKSSGGEIIKDLKKPALVLDPMELCNNVTKNISRSMLKVFVDYFMDSAIKISKTVKDPKNIDEDQSDSD